MARLDTGTIQRSAINTSTGLPGAGANLSFAPIDPLAVTPGGFIGLGFEGGPFDACLSLYTPFTRVQHFGDSGVGATDGPGRYHAFEQIEYDTYATIATGIRLSDRIFVGLGFSLVFSQVHLGFDRDTALDGGTPVVSTTGYETNDHAERINVSGQGTSGAFSVGFATRILGDAPSPDGLFVGGSYTSRPFSPSRSDVQLGPATFLQSTTPFNALIQTPSGASLAGIANIEYTLPDMLDLGARYHQGKIETALTARYLDYGVLRTVDVRLFGADLASQGVPEHIARYRGLQATFNVDMRASYELSPTLWGTGGLILQTSEVPADNMNPSELDAPKASPYVSLEWKPADSLTLSAFYELGIPLPRTVNPGVYNPQFEVDCVDSHNDLNVCTDRRLGIANPTAAGTYNLLFHTLSASMRYDF
jgi:hypothetical protein